MLLIDAIHLEKTLFFISISSLKHRYTSKLSNPVEISEVLIGLSRGRQEIEISVFV